MDFYNHRRNDYSFFYFIYLVVGVSNPEWVEKISEILKDKKEIHVEEGKPKIIWEIKEDGLLWTEMLIVLYKIKKRNKDIISFPNVFEKICSKFSITKAKAWNCLFFLKEFGLIEIISCHGIKLNYKIT